MLSLPVFIGLLIISVLGLALGAVYYFSPEKVVDRRIKARQKKIAQKDPEFKRFLEAERQKQINHCRRMGMIIVVLEAIWIVLIIGLWQKSGGA